MSHFLREAHERKEWADRTRDDAKWLASASDYSKEMLKKYLNKTVEQIAAESYDYSLMRAHGVEIHGRIKYYIDPQERELWKRLIGRYPRDHVSVHV
jgi:hypothetical protein